MSASLDLKVPNISWRSQPFALSMEGKYGLLFRFGVQWCTGKTCMSFLSFFSAIFAGPRFVEFQTFCYYGNVTQRLFSMRVWQYRYGNIIRNLSWSCVGVMSNYNVKLFMGKEDTYHFVSAWPGGKSAWCCNPEASSFSPLLAASWICSRQSWVQILGYAFKDARTVFSPLHLEPPELARRLVAGKNKAFQKSLKRSGRMPRLHIYISRKGKTFFSPVHMLWLTLLSQDICLLTPQSV